ncbi:Alpha/Beta hydrolase protein [Xylariaceae sp. FL0016]|nr:Alpha/Beta hydrolase protein [Xylariaceae sp. FL0016]
MPDSPSNWFESSPTWAAMLSDPQGPAAGAKLTYDPSIPLPWKKNREDRARMEAAWSKEYPPSKYGYERKEHLVTMRDGASIPVMVYRPLGSGSSSSSTAAAPPTSNEPLPLVFNTHGGGWYQGSTLTEEIFLMRALMHSFNFVIVSPEFRLVPEHPFPTGLDDCWDTLLWTLRNQSSLAFDPQNVLLAASSAGGSLTATIATRLGNASASSTATDGGAASPRALPGLGTAVRVRGVVLNVPITCHPDHLPPGYPHTSYAEACSGTTLLCSEEMRAIWDLYAPGGSGGDPDMSPLLADLRHFPPARIYVAGQDPVRDEAVAFATKLRELGRDVTLTVYPGVPHVFTMFDDLEETKKLWNDVKVGIQSLLGAKGTKDAK